MCFSILKVSLQASELQTQQVKLIVGQDDPVFNFSIQKKLKTSTKLRISLAGGHSRYLLGAVRASTSKRGGPVLLFEEVETCRN